jgi:hypothetical protein
MVRIVLPSGWAHRGQTEFDGVTGNLNDVLKAFCAANPDYRHRMLGPDGEPRTYFCVYLDDELVPRERRAEATVPAGSTLVIVPPLAGG